MNVATVLLRLMRHQEYPQWQPYGFSLPRSLPPNPELAFYNHPHITAAFPEDVDRLLEKYLTGAWGVHTSSLAAKKRKASAHEGGGVLIWGLIKATQNKNKTFVCCHKSSAEQQEAVNLAWGERGSQSPSQSAPFWFSTELFNCVSRVSISQAQFQGQAQLLSLVFWSCLPVKKQKQTP